MRTQHRLYLLLAITLGLLIGGGSCTKFRENREYFTLYDHDVAEDAYNDMFRLVCQQGGPIKITDSCYSITASSATYPVTYTFTFGGTDCSDRYQMKRRGSIAITFNQDFATTGAVATVTPGSDYYFNDYKVDGIMTVTNSGTGTAGHQLYDLAVAKASMTTSQNETYTWNCHHTMELFNAKQGSIFDDVYHYTGSAAGTDHEGHTFSVTINDTLTKQQTCRWPSKGNITITISGLDDKEVNYGSNDCDNNLVDCCDNQVDVKTGGKRSQSLSLN